MNRYLFYMILLRFICKSMLYAYIEYYVYCEIVNPFLAQTVLLQYKKNIIYYKLCCCSFTKIYIISYAALFYKIYMYIINVTKVICILPSYMYAAIGLQILGFEKPAFQCCIICITIFQAHAVTVLQNLYNYNVLKILLQCYTICTTVTKQLLLQCFKGCTVMSQKIY